MEEASEEEAILERLVPHTDLEEAVLVTLVLKTALLEADLMVVSAVAVLMVPVMEMALETAAIAALVAVTSRNAQDLNAEISISFNEAAFGCDKLINLSGADGSGKQTLKVHIPAGIDNGKSIRLRGKGNPGYGGAPAGDLLLKVHVGERPGFERKGTDVYTTVNVPFITAALGGEAKVQTLNGQVMCRIPEGTQSGSKIRLKGKGIQVMGKAGVYGDLYVTVQVQVPRNLSEESKRRLREFDTSTRMAGTRGSRTA